MYWGTGRGRRRFYRPKWDAAADTDRPTSLHESTAQARSRRHDGSGLETGGTHERGHSAPTNVHTNAASPSRATSPRL